MIKRTAAVVFSVGWLLPMWVGSEVLLGFIYKEAEYDPYPIADIALQIAFVWLACVLGVHAWRLWGKQAGTT